LDLKTVIPWKISLKTEDPLKKFEGLDDEKKRRSFIET